MCKFCAVLFAFLLHCLGLPIFREPTTPPSGPLLSYLIFLLSLMILLWNLGLYPISLRKIWKWGDCFIQFLVADFIIEHMMANFWIPLEGAIMLLMPALGIYLEEAVGMESLQLVYDTFKDDTMGILSSYCLSLFFLFAVLHATSAIDFDFIECGYGVFFKHVIEKIGRGLTTVTCIFYVRKKVDTGDIPGVRLDSEGGEHCAPFQPLFQCEPPDYEYCRDQNTQSDSNCNSQCNCSNDNDSESLSSDFECHPPLPTRRRRLTIN